MSEKREATIYDFARMCIKGCETCPIAKEFGDDIVWDKHDKAMRHKAMMSMCILRMHCDGRMGEHKFSDIVVKWCDEHPEKKRKTYCDDFNEKFPKAPRYADGTPEMCPSKLYDVKDACHTCSCAECWNREMEEEK